MKKGLCLLLTLCLTLSLAGALAAGPGISAPLIMKLATRTGPSTNYDEQGTHFINNWSSTWVTVLTKAWDKRNDIWWLQVEYKSGGKWYRSYTGLKRVDVNINSVPEEQIYGSDTVRYDTDALWGPGTQYVTAKRNVPAGTAVSVYDWENGYVQVEFYDSRTSCYRRAWVPDSSLRNGGWSWIGGSSGGFVSGFQTGTYGRNGADSDCVWISSVDGSRIRFNLYFDAVATIEDVQAEYNSDAGGWRFSHNAGSLGMLYGHLDDVGGGWAHLVIEYCTNSGFFYVLQQEGYTDIYFSYMSPGRPYRPSHAGY